MTPSAWWSTLMKWTGGFTRMMIKLQHLGHTASYKHRPFIEAADTVATSS
jgi:hypothetical protein